MNKKKLLNNSDVAYYDSGKGKPIVFLHSFAHNKAMWFPQLTYCLERGYRVIAPDMPGHGDSSFDSENHTVDQIAQKYIELLGKLKVRDVVLVGISMGGYIALRMWARKPELISALVLSNTKAEADTDEIVGRRKTQISNINQHGLAEFIRKGAPKRLSPAVLQRRPWVLDSIRMMNFTVSAEVNAATLNAMAVKDDDTDTLSTITVPTLITTGSDDAFIPTTSAGILQAGIRNSQLQVIEESGHASNIENPTQYNQVLERFLTSLE